MKTPQEILSERVRAAIAPLGVAPPEPVVVPSQDGRFGDYQCNAAMGLAKAMKLNPRGVATQIVSALKVEGICDEPAIAGPGFINLRLQADWIGARLDEMCHDERLGVRRVDEPETIVVDYSSPNVAKTMHVGHIRSTIIGDALARMLRFAGHHVITDNHLGDWGTAFGALIVGYRKFADTSEFEKDPIAELERIYRLATGDPALQDQIRAELAKMQAGDEENLRLWRLFMETSRRAFETLYDRLDVHFDLWHGESFYNSLLSDTVASLVKAGIAQESEGAIVVFFGQDEPPAIIRKSDGAHLYMTTDLAAIRYRVQELHCDRFIILTDRRQQLHFKQLFEIACRWGYGEVGMAHVAFGSILGESGTPFKTRGGDTIKLEALLDEAEERALLLARENERGASLSEAQLLEIAREVGIGAVKYADLSQNPASDYTFNWDKMLAMTGNTGPYLQMAYARTQAIFRKGDVQPKSLVGPVQMGEEAERALGLVLLRFGEALEAALIDYKPNRLTSWLYDVAVAFSIFFEKCPVLKADEPIRTSRLTLCRLTADALHLGLDLLGIHTLPQM
ncbi:MAG TPA: arginine--tRNA ligase [Candidatus Xenobia bacterium]|jgi:arginyl-tRNA synthetase